MAEINCPMCGKPNPEDLDLCQFCEASLKPVTDALSRAQPPIPPGQAPTPMDTGELEPILPQWLQSVRKQSRESAEDESGQVPEAEETIQVGEESTDLLAGLQAQNEDDEEIPDWLSGLRGENASAPKTVAEGDDLAALKNMFGEEDAPALQEEDNRDSALPGWVSGLDGVESGDQPAASDSAPGLPFEPETESVPQQESTSSVGDEDLSWLSALGDESAQDEPQAAPTQPVTEDDTPDWLSSLGGETNTTPEEESTLLAPGTEEETPDWLASLESGGEEQATLQDEVGADIADGESEDQAFADFLREGVASLEDESAREALQEAEVQPAADTGNTPDWLASLESESDNVGKEEAVDQLISEDEMPDWLSSTSGESTETVPEQEQVLPGSDQTSDAPDWLTSLEGESEEQAAPQVEAKETVSGGDMPDWLSSLGGEGAEDTSQQVDTSPMDTEDIPDWAASLGEGSSLPQDESAPVAAFVEEEGQPTPGAEEETPDWLASLGGDTPETEQPVDETQAPAFTTDGIPVDGSAPSAFVDDEGEPLMTEDVDALLSSEIPDWLSDVEGQAETTSPEGQEDELKPANLPSWVQAMRPVESVVTEAGDEFEESQPMEESGPLAGLRGVLPAVQGVGPSSVPKTYSLKLQASEEQQTSAVMLEQMLGEEVEPKPIVTQPIVFTQRILRWVIAVLIFAVVGGTVFAGTQTNLMPTSATLETSKALRYVQEVPAESPVLLIFDYEAAQSGEMEAAAAPLIDHMLILKNPRLTLVSSTPTGTGLAERFIKIMQQDRIYNRGENFTNLGYLPGGAAGVLAFSESPVNLKPLSTAGQAVWNTPLLQDVENLSDFAAVILITSDSDSARIWIEQTETARGETPFIAVSSAQSGPMILPYVQSGQVDGMVTGISDSASVEQANSGRPGLVRRYWDAYGFGLLTAVGLIVFGSLWSLGSGIRARSQEQGEE